jgi:hypothetical protein
VTDPGRSPVSRREILAALGTVGTVGALSGAGTAAFLSDNELATGAIQAGSLDLLIECTDESCQVAEDGSFSVAVPDLVPGASGRTEIVLTQTGNPAWLWLGSTCPQTALERAIDVRMTFDRGCDGSDEYLLEGTLQEVLLELSRGVRLTDRCLRGAEQACLTLEWDFRNQPEVERYAGESLDFEFQFGSIQCRHTNGSTRPFPARECVGGGAGISYIEIWTCAESGPDCNCEVLGKLELSAAYVDACPDLRTEGISENRIEPGAYDLPADDDCVDTSYDVLVTGVTDNTDGETVSLAFDLLDADGDPGPEICKVVVKSGQETVVYEAEDLVPRSNSTDGEVGGSSR